MRLNDNAVVSQLAFDTCVAARVAWLYAPSVAHAPGAPIKSIQDQAAPIELVGGRGLVAEFDPERG